MVIARSVTLVAGRCGARDVSGIPANSSSAQRFPNPGTYPIACTVNADESIVVTVDG